MKINILTTSDFPEGGAGENFVRNLATGLMEAGSKVRVTKFFGAIYGNYNTTKILSRDYLFFQPIKNRYLKIIEGILQIVIIPFFVFNMRFIYKEKCLILYGIDRFYFLFPLLISCKTLRIKVFRIITEEYPIEVYQGKLLGRFLYLSEKIQFLYFDRFFDGLIVLSTFLRDLCLTNKVNAHKILIIPNLIDFNIIPSRKIILNEGSIIIGYSGTISESNGIFDLIQAFNILELKTKNIKLTVIGFVSEEVKAKLNSGLYRLDNIHFTGRLNREDVFNELYNCDVLINPRRLGALADSGFPTKIGEYFSLMKPVVTTTTGDLPKLLIDRKHCVFSEPNNPNSITSSVLWLLSDFKNLKKIGLDGYAWAKMNLDYQKNSIAIRDFIHNLK